MRCKETSGILFNHPCKREAAFNCFACNKPICENHMRYSEDKPHCITCMRTNLKESRTSKGRARSGYEDDPYFFYYYYGSSFDDYDDDDYSLFDDSDAGEAYAMDDDGAWAGS